MSLERALALAFVVAGCGGAAPPAAAPAAAVASPAALPSNTAPPAAATPSAATPAACTVSTSADYERCSVQLANDLLALLRSDLDCDALGAAMSKLFTERGDLLRALTAWEHGHAADKKAFDVAHKDLSDQLLDVFGKAAERCHGNQAFKDAITKLPG